jgi:hypothetical protein
VDPVPKGAGDLKERRKGCWCLWSTGHMMVTM